MLGTAPTQYQYAMCDCKNSRRLVVSASTMGFGRGSQAFDFHVPPLATSSLLIVESVNREVQFGRGKPRCTFALSVSKWT